MSYELFEQGPGAYIPVLLVSLLITLAVYCAFPLIFACIRKKPITSRKYRVICFCFNFLPCVAFFLWATAQRGRIFCGLLFFLLWE